MRKFTLLALMLAIGLASFAQRANQSSLFKSNVRTKSVFVNHFHANNQRAVGDSIWGNDFSNAGDWTMYHTGGTAPNSGNPPGDWEIQNTQNTSAGYNTGTITNSTWQNGFAIYDADAYGDDANGEDAYIEYTGTIDCSTYSSIALTCAQYGRKWQTTQMFVEVSTDGSTWTSYEVNTDWTESVTGDNPININISATAANQATVHIRFHYYGGYDYDWCVDDVKIIEGADYDLVAQNWIPNCQDRDGYVTGWYSEMPKHQTSPLALFEVPIFNNGIYSLTGLNMQVTINDGTSDVYDQNTTTTLSGNTDIASSALDTLYNDVAFSPDSTQPCLTYTNYTVSMSVNETETDQDMTSNILNPPYTFTVTDSTMRRAVYHSTYTGIYRFTSSASGDVIGTKYYIPNVDTVSSASMFFSPNTTFGNGESVMLALYMQDPGTGNWIEVIDALDVYDLSASDTTTGHMVTIPFNTDGFTEIIQPGYYIVGLKSYFDPTTQTIGLWGDNLFPHNNPVSSMVYIAGQSGWGYSSAGVPDIILNFKSNCPVGINTQSSQYDKINIYPNPASTEIHVDNAEGATIEVYNLMGQSVMTVENANKFNTVNVESLAAGTYIVKVVNNNDVKTQKINIVK